MRHSKPIFATILTIVAMVAQAQNQKPNVIVILADDVGYKSLSCNGGNLYSTPNIDKLAKKGMRFTQCHASPTCSPSRYLLLTGKYNFRNYYDWGNMDVNEKTIGNMMKDAGYKTGFFGKDQLGGGEQSLNSWGFDDYCVHGPFDELNSGNPYKNPHLYTHGDFLPNNAILNKYGPDIISDSVLGFIEKNKSNPFFVFYPMMLVHQPVSPTPDDSAFKDRIWDNKKNYDTAFYPSMMHYMDKLIGQVIDKLKDLGIENNTIVFYCGDNGTATLVADHSDGDSVITGGKRGTTELGTRVPLIAYWPNTIEAGTVNNDEIDFTDFFPTIAGITNTSLPTNYGPLDGVSFSDRLKGKPGTPRDWIFYHYDFRPGESELKRWAQNRTYKLYDTSLSSKTRLFYNIKDDVNEKKPIPDMLLTPNELAIKEQLLNVINYYVAQGKPIIALNPSVSVTDSSFVLTDTIRVNGGSTVTASGVVWSTDPNPEISTANHTKTGVILGAFSTLAKTLKANTTYYARAYATNFAGTTYSNQVTFKTSLKIPVATKATQIDTNKFTANWRAYTGATEYRLDVSTSPTFTKINAPAITEGFNNGVTPPAGWTIKGTVVADSSSFGAASPSIEFTGLEGHIVTNQLDMPATRLKFWVMGTSPKNPGSLLVEGFDGNEWSVIANLTNFSETGEVKIFDATSNPSMAQNYVQFRFTYAKAKGKIAIDDVSIKYSKPVPFLIPGYDDLLIKTNSQTVTGLEAGTNYYYQVRAITKKDTTASSYAVGVTTLSQKQPVAGTKFYEPGEVTDGNSINITKTNGAGVRIFPNPSTDEFTLTSTGSNTEKMAITVMDMKGKVLYQVAGINNRKYVFGKAFLQGEYFVNVKTGNLNRTIKIIKLK